MPRLKKFRFSPKVVKKRQVNGGGTSSVTMKVSTPVSSSSTSTTTATEMENNDVPTLPPPPAASSSSPHPHLVCVVCYNQFPYYTLSCIPWESAVTKDFYVALNIPEDDAVAGLPFCPECHSKVAVMFTLHQQLQNILQSFNCVRNDLAFTVVDSIGQNCRKGPMDLIRQQIYKRWKDLHAKAKEVKSGDVYDPESTLAYLTPKLSVADEFPTNPSTMNMSGAAKERLSQLRQTPGSLGLGTVIPKRKAGRPPVNKPTMDMPKLEPMENFKLMADGQAGPSRSIRQAAKGREVTLGQSKLAKVGKTNLKLGQKSKPTITNSKIKTTGFDTSASEGKFQLTNHFTPNSTYRKKAPKRLANGRWKCNYCPMTYLNCVCVYQHESRCHPQTRPFLCTMCPKGFLTLDGMRKHLQAMHNDVVEGCVKCPYCPRHFTRQNGFSQHISTFHKGKKAPSFELLVKSSKEALVVPPTTKVGKKGMKVAPSTVPIPKGSPPSPEITDLEGSSSSAGGKKKQTHGKRGRKKSSSSSQIKNVATSPSVEGEVVPKEPLTNGGGSSIPNKFDKNKKTEEEDMELRQSETDAVNDDDKEQKESKTEQNESRTSHSTEAEDEDALPAKRRRTSTLYLPLQIRRRSAPVVKKPKPILTCPVCNKTFLGPHALAGHGKSHRGRGGKNKEAEEEDGGVGTNGEETEGSSQDKNGDDATNDDTNSDNGLPKKDCKITNEDVTKTEDEKLAGSNGHVVVE